MSAQKIALVCLMVFAVVVANGIVELMSRTTMAVVAVDGRIEMRVCIADTAHPDHCLFALRLDHR